MDVNESKVIYEFEQINDKDSNEIINKYEVIDSNSNEVVNTIIEKSDKKLEWSNTFVIDINKNDKKINKNYKYYKRLFYKKLRYVYKCYCITGDMDLS